MWGLVGPVIRQRPFVPIVILFGSGIVAAYGLHLELSVGVLLLCAALGATLVDQRLGLSLLTFAFGAALYSTRYEILSENDLRLILEEKPALVTIRGSLIETPGVREFPGRTNNVEYSYARVAVDEILFEKQWRPAYGTVASTTRGVFDQEWFKGRSVEITGVIAPPKRAAAPGLFDFHQYLYNARVFYQLRCESTKDWRLTSLDSPPVAERFQRWAHRQLARGLPHEDEPLEMVRAMALGTTQSLTGEVADVFMRTGTMHIFAISGLHVACIAGCILILLRLAGVPRDRAALVLIPLVWFYTLATGWQSSAVRSALMSTFVFAGWAIRRPTELLNSTAGAALLILLFEPEQLFQASFQLSFSVVAVIALILGRALGDERWSVGFQNRLLGYDPLLPRELRPNWKKWIEIPVAFVIGNLMISGASWIGSSPLTAYYFNMVTPISLVANLVAVPLSSISLAATLGSLLFPPLGSVFNYLSWATMWETIEVTRWLANFSWGFFYVPKPNLWFFVAYFGVVTVCVIPMLRTRYAFAAAGLAVLVWVCSLVPSSGATVITMVPARGSPVMIDSPGRANDLLIDTSNARGAEQVLKRFLHGQGIGVVKNVLLTHGDINHVGGFAAVRKDFSPVALFASDVRAKSRAYRDVISEAEQMPGLLRKVSAGESVLNWSVLHPPAGSTFPKADDNAVVLRAEIAGWRILFLSELGSLGRKALLEGEGDLKADILICGEEGASSEFVAAVAPRLVVTGRMDTPFNRHRARERSKDFGQRGAWVVVGSSESGVTLEIAKGVCRIQTGDGPSVTLHQ